MLQLNYDQLLNRDQYITNPNATPMQYNREKKVWEIDAEHRDHRKFNSRDVATSRHTTIARAVTPMTVEQADHSPTELAHTPRHGDAKTQKRSSNTPVPKE